MLSNYQNKNSIIHNINPTIKILCIIILLITSVISNTIIGHILILSIIIIMCYTTNIDIKYYIKKITNLNFFLITLFIFNLFFKIPLYDDIIIIFKLIEIIIYTTIITYTTNLKAMNYGIEKLLSFLKIFKINYKIITLSITLSISFIPIIIDQANKIIKSLKSRAVDFKNNTFSNKILIIKSIIIPIILTSLNRADKLATTMELNLFDINNIKSNYYKYKIKFYDILYLILHIGLLILIMKEEIII